jgi:mono/diheme cytochrome c family protein
VHNQEETMYARTTNWLFAALFALTMAITVQGQQKPEIKHAPITRTSPASGAAMYKAYCAVCHGLDGTGNGPAAEALKTPPANLTLLSQNNGGKFPAMKVVSTIRGEAGVPAHGTREMPIWGHLFWTVSGGHESEVQQRVANLTKYVESLQAK